jgi:hypothetical protein
MCAALNLVQQLLIDDAHHSQLQRKEDERTSDDEHTDLLSRAVALVLAALWVCVGGSALCSIHASSAAI